MMMEEKETTLDPLPSTSNATTTTHPLLSDCDTTQQEEESPDDLFRLLLPEGKLPLDKDKFR